MKKKIDAHWGDGMSDLFISVKGGKPELLDYEFDTERLHEMCGGRNYYCSCSGCSGAGYFTRLGSLIRLGGYRVDTAHNDFQWFTSVGTREDREEVSVAVPYVSHTEDKSEILRDHPTVVKFGQTVVYCDFSRNFCDVLKLVLTSSPLPEECEMAGYTHGRRGHRTLRKTFIRLDSWGEPEEKEVTVEFYNLSSADDAPNPWEFFQDELKEYQAGWDQERMLQLLSAEKLEDGTFVRTMKIAGTKYRGKALAGNPLETGHLTAGWQRIADDVLVRFYDRSNEAHLVAYAPARAAYEKLARRLANRMGEGEEFISFVSSHEDEYVEFELMVPRALFLLDEAAQVAEVRQGLARKVREDIMSRARRWVDDVNDRVILESVPDDMVITFADSLAAGNCRPGTEAFVDRFFPGQTETTAKELKKYADNYSVMRIFYYLTTVGRFDWKARRLA